MGSEWSETNLSKIAALKNGKGLKTSQYCDDGPYPVWGANGPIARTHQLLNDHPVVVIGRVGAYCGSVHRVSEPNWVTDNAIVATPKGNTDFLFLYYLLKHIRPERTSIGSAQPLVTQIGLKSLQCVVPTSNDEQRAIAHILGSLDDKIELNRRMNRTLEATAQAIFKSWFVDFDPVRAKAEGQDTSLPKEIADLFPDRLEDSELGEIPKGWKATTLKDGIHIFDSKRIPLNKRQRAKRPGPYPYYGAAGVMDHVDDYLFDGVYVLTGEDGSVADDSSHPVVQYVWGRFWVNNHAHILQGKNGISTEHLYLLLKQTHITPFVTGAVQPKLNQKNLKAVPMVLAPELLSGAFATASQPLFEQLREATEQNKVLQKLRDTLLPRLISGELRLPDAEKFVEEAGI